MPVYFKSQIQVGALLFDEAFTKVLAEYSNYSNVFSMKNAVELPKNTRINEHVIKQKENKQPRFGPIYSLRSVKLENLKTYIKTNLANSFIQLSKSSAEALIFFDKKLDRNLRLYMDY